MKNNGRSNNTVKPSSVVAHVAATLERLKVERLVDDARPGITHAEAEAVYQATTGTPEEKRIKAALALFNTECEKANKIAALRKATKTSRTSVTRQRLELGRLLRARNRVGYANAVKRVSLDTRELLDSLSGDGSWDTDKGTVRLALWVIEICTGKLIRRRGRFVRSSKTTSRGGHPIDLPVRNLLLRLLAIYADKGTYAVGAPGDAPGRSINPPITKSHTSRLRIWLMTLPGLPPQALGTDALVSAAREYRTMNRYTSNCDDLPES